MAAALDIKLNGERLVTVSVHGMRMVDVRAHGDHIGPELASCHVSGMTVGENGHPDEHPWWIEDQELKAGDELEIEFLAEGATSRRGLTIEEAHPDWQPLAGPPESREDVIAKVAAEPKVRDHITFELIDASGRVVTGRTMPDEHGFAFGVSWIWLHPERARVNLHCYGLEYLLERKEDRDLATFRITTGQRVRFRVGAP